MASSRARRTTSAPGRRCSRTRPAMSTVLPAASDVGDARVLILAPLGRDGAAVAELLRRIGLEARVCGGLAELLAGLEAGAEAAFVAEEALLRGPAEALETWVARQ